MKKLSKSERRHRREERNREAKIRYNLLRDAGYSVAEAKSLRYTKTTFDVTGIRVKKSGRVEKGKNYQSVKRIVTFNDRINVLRCLENPSAFTKHGFLTNRPKDPKLDTREYKQARDEYYEMAMAVKKRDNLSNDQAWYFMNFMIQNNYTYEQTRKELLGNEDFERYRQSKRNRR